jgi:uncharacterized SAM-binding protein YcdF (DUF218 family)
MSYVRLSVTRAFGHRIPSRRLRRFAILGSLAVLLWLFAWAAASKLIVRSPLPHSDALLVLAGSSTFKERTNFAARLWREGLAPRIILTNDNQQSGWSTVEQRNPYYVERAVAELKQAGIPAQEIDIIQQPISSTYEEAIVVREHAKKNNLRAIVIVTSAYHSRRAWWTLSQVFRGTDMQLGIEPVPPGQQTPTPATWLWRLVGWRMVAGEYVKLAYYRVKYA